MKHERSISNLQTASGHIRGIINASFMHQGRGFSSLKIELCAMQKGSMMKHKRCIGFIKKYKGGIGNIQISIKRSIVEVYCLFVIKCINYAYKMHRLCVQNA